MYVRAHTCVDAAQASTPLALFVCARRVNVANFCTYVRTPMRVDVAQHLHAFGRAAVAAEFDAWPRAAAH